MEGRKNPPPRPLRPKSKTPAERAVEFTATQRRLKEEASARRAARESQPPSSGSK